MELVKSSLSMGRQKSKAMTYAAKEEAFNLNESMEDIAHILQQRGEVNIHEIRGEENKVRVLGEVSFSILYESASLERHLSSYNGRMSFEEDINIEGLVVNDDISMQANIEELKIEVVNSRKIRVNSMVSLMVTAEEMLEEEILTDVSEENRGVQTKKNKIKFLNKCAHIRDSAKIDGDITLPTGHENIGKLIWYRVTPYNVEFSNQEGQITLSGDLQIFALYQSEDEMKTEFIQETMPFSKMIPADNCTDGSILNARFNCSSADVEVQADYDGEDRSLHILCMLDLDISIYKEETVEFVEDIYSVRESVRPVTSMLTCQKLLSQNTSKCRINEPVSIKKSQNTVLQLMCSSGKIKGLKQNQEDGGVLVDGSLEISGLLVTSDDEQPFEKFEGMVPFKHLVEIPNMDMQSEYQIEVRLEQLSVSMAGENEIEVKALVSVVVLAYDIVLYPVILKIDTEEIDSEVMKRIPGITGYVVKEEDTLWDIAKKYMTTIDELKEINELKTEELHSGDTIIIVKTVGEYFSDLA